MLRSINVAIPEEAANQLAAPARREYRRPADQAAVLLVGAITRATRDLERRPGAAVVARLDKAADR